MYSKFRIYMRVFRICIILLIERVEKIRGVTWSVSTNVMYRSVLSCTGM